MNKQEDVIKKFKEVHGDRYDYSKVAYSKMTDNVEIICEKHGSFFQSPHAHLKGQGCPKCGIESRSKKREYSTSEFIEKANKVHNGIYGYDKTNYKGSLENVTITCPVHGYVDIRADMHLIGRGCPMCGKELRNKNESVSYDEFIKRSISVHGNTYLYDKTKEEYKNASTKVTITCKKHGDFKQLPSNHMNGIGCKKCADEINGRLRIKTTEEFINDSISVHGDEYDYSKTKYNGCNERVIITCKKHGDFSQKPTYHLSGNGCPLCGVFKSNGEDELYEFIKSSCECDVIRNDRATLNGKELDIYVPSLNIAFEFDGLYWHSERQISDNSYHLDKTELCLQNGIRLIHIFEDEWNLKKDICKSRILSLLNKNENMVYARKCEVKEIDYLESKKFIDENHIQGNVMSKIRIGLFYDGELISVMTFGSLRKNLGNKPKEGCYEMLRFCSKKGYSIIGGAGKMQAYFVKKYSPHSIISYADRRWSNGGLYEKLGYDLIRKSRPNYFYIKNGKRINRYSLRKDVLISKYGCDENETEHSFCLKNGLYRIYDCGTLVFQKIFI